MELPFSHDAFLDVFGAYNTELWPAVGLLWLATAIVAWRRLVQGSVNERIIFGLLAVHWAWSGIVYHWSFFRGINEAATLFGALFVGQAALFTWLAFRSGMSPKTTRSAREFVGGALVLYGLAYPLLNFGFGLEYPRLPLFAVPCPTTLVTAGLLVASTRVPRVVNVVPAVWAAIGASAALALGIRADWALVAAGVVLVLETIAPFALGQRPQPDTPRVGVVS